MTDHDGQRSRLEAHQPEGPLQRKGRRAFFRTAAGATILAVVGATVLGGVFLSARGGAVPASALSVTATVIMLLGGVAWLAWHVLLAPSGRLRMPVARRRAREDHDDAL